jgi:DNA mismatch repair protein MSH4
LRPLTDVSTLNTRLDTVEIFLRTPHLFNQISQLLPMLPDLDRCLSYLVTVPKAMTAKVASQSIETLMMLRASIKLSFQLGSLIDQLCAMSQGQNCELLIAIAKSLQDSELSASLQLIDESLSESAEFSKSGHEKRQSECFALKAGLHPKLDISRITFLDSVENIYSLAAVYAEDLNVPVKVIFSATRGYVLQVPTSLLSLPDTFILAVQQKKTITCTTEDVLSLSDRASESIQDCLLLTHELLLDVLSRVRERVGVIFTAVDSISIADMLVSFADLVALSPLPFTRPQLKTDGPLVIQKGRHPIVDRVQKHQFIENDSFLSTLNNFVIITGTNGSGKSVYLKQVALITILAQIGCFVPATHACIRIRDRILSRIGTSDDLENNMSTFYGMLEFTYQE